MNSPAKINLTLEILGKRPDGYHTLSTVFQRLAFCDRLTFDWSGPDVALQCSDARVPQGDSNLIVKAVRALGSRVGAAIHLKITLEKQIPMGAGLGGGSSNAAAVMREVGQTLGVSPNILSEVAESLGADVPFFLNGATARGSGKGELLEALPGLPRFEVVILKPSFSISTAEAYGKINRYSTGRKTQQLAEAIRLKSFGNIFSYFTNDFETALFPVYPQLKEIKELFLSHGALAAQLSGSGSALFAFARDREHAEKLAHCVEHLGTVWVTQTA